MTVDYLIIGQGISGTWLSYYLLQAQKRVLVIDDKMPNAPSRIAAGIINPVTGRRHVEVWMADTIIPFARKAYHDLGTELGISAISDKKIIDFFPSPQMRLSFTDRIKEKASYMSLPDDEKKYLPRFQYDFGYGEIAPACTVHLENILPVWRKILQKRQALLEEEFETAYLSVIPGQVKYKDIIAEKIIFCDGASGSSNPWFGRLPFAPNKGEAITLEIKDLPSNCIYKKGLSLVSLSEPGQWWIGSAYTWDFEDESPTSAFYEKTDSLLKEWLKVPFIITGHLAGLRPATLERRPFVGLHPLHPAIGILNGMGTKGCSLAPFFARQLADHLLSGQAITPEADIKRFSGLLSR
jgi:glycine/D-amino acid oxidase-like deaminating enzyme